MLPTSFIPATPRVRRKRRQDATQAAPPVALTLVSAVFNALDQFVTLTFDRAIDFAAMDVSQIVLDDGQFAGIVYVGSGTPTADGANGVDVALGSTAGAASPGVHLSATGATGIVAVDDGGAWAGVTNLELPFP